MSCCNLRVWLASDFTYLLTDHSYVINSALLNHTPHTEKNYSTCLYLINSVESAFFYALKYISDILYPALDRVTNITKTLCMAVDFCTTLSIVRHLSHKRIIYGTNTGTCGRKIRVRSHVSNTKLPYFTHARNTMQRHLKNFNTPFGCNIVIYWAYWLPRSTLIQLERKWTNFIFIAAPNSQFTKKNRTEQE